jgi:glyoxylase-like metal-dependent hydrolase (beta-lactamase superfamily II)
MLFRQLFDQETWTYSYLVADQRGKEAVIVDPVIEHTDRYLQLIRELNLKLLFAVDTHVHADHVTALGKLRDETECVTIMGNESRAACVSLKVKEGEKIKFGQFAMDVLYTPGHTDDSYSFLLPDRVFTGDTLLIRSTGRTDFQNGNAEQSYDSIFDKLLKLPESMFVYPAHDYKGWTVSTIGEEKRFNPRLQVKGKKEYAEIMNSLNLPNPKFMDVAVPANLACGNKNV